MFEDIFELAKLSKKIDRVNWIIDHANCKHYFQASDNNLNIILEGTDKSVLYMAHYDVVNEWNANDNTASIINLLEFKAQHPEKTIAFTDNEEPPSCGIGAECLVDYILENRISRVLNLELTGIGETIFYDRSLDKINYGEEYSFPFSDGVIIKNNLKNIKVSTLILLPKDNKKIIYDCHSNRDTVDQIRIDQMKSFVDTLSKIDFV